MVGSKLAHYQITHHLGSGGFGDVYQATDTKLGRSVALKLLPEAFSQDAERVARLQREARILASLNHPNIAAIYGLEQSGGRNFLVMEFVAGETLAQCIQRGPIPMEEALGIARQIAEALEAAHDNEKAIIHRDLKPANVKITPDGKVKVLDFGLAKAYETESASMDLSNSPTLVSMAATNAGVILGTAAYMSPEQAKGRRVDRRTDIFAFGSVLYEMLTGRPAFEGDGLTEILGRVVTTDPDWDRLPTKTPASIRKLLRRALKKDPRERLGDVRDARLEIEEALSEATAETSHDWRPPTSRQRTGWIVTAVFLIAVSVLAVPTVRHFREAPPPEMRVEVSTPSSTNPEFALSPDGMHVAFVATDNGPERLWVRPLNAVAAQPLLGTDGARYPFWSPDSRSLGFFASGKLKRIEIDGGPPRTLADAPAGRGGAWNQGGIILFSSTTDAPLSRIPANGGTVEITTHLEQGGISHRFPQFLPDGQHFLFYVVGTLEHSGIYLGFLDSSQVTRLTAADAQGAWMPPGWLLYLQDGTLQAQALDIPRRTLIGNSVTVADPVGFESNYYGQFSVSAAGIVAYRGRVGLGSRLTWFDRTGNEAGTVAEGQNVPELSPDGRRVAADRTIQGDRGIWLIDVLRGGSMRFTFDTAADRYPQWSPDGTQIVFRSNRNNTSDLYTKSSSGAGVEQLLLQSPNPKTPYGWSPDGSFLLYAEDNPKTARDLWALPMRGDRKPVAIVNSPFSEGDGQFSPDGRWVAYHSNESGRYEIYVVPFPPGGGKWQISTGGGISPRWRHDGKELFFISPDAHMMAATISASGTSFEAATPVGLFQTRIVGGGTNVANKHQYAVATDGRFLINAGAPTTAPITLLLNWKPLTK